VRSDQINVIAGLLAADAGVGFDVANRLRMDRAFYNDTITAVSKRGF
jgi:hypothetical protein